MHPSPSGPHITDHDANPIHVDWEEPPVEKTMSIDALKARVPDYAKDLRLNLGSLATEPSLSVQQRAGTFVVSALATRNAEVTRGILAEFGPQLSPEALSAAKSAAAIMGMNNAYYRFTHLVGGDYANMPAK